ncbi:MAG: hypothetical protein GXP31_07860 [Kiritimatiellaeota bacterium]|nr:hypothetical protein [Kiritimatiellota bacterium]
MIWIVWAMLAAALGLSGCGGEPPQLPAGPPPPLAIKDIRFGADRSEVERVFRPLEKRSEAFGRAVYTHIPAKGRAIMAYNFEFLDGKLAACVVVYRAAEFDKVIGRERLFRRIVSKYGARQDLGSTKGHWRWFNIEGGVTITWNEDFQRKIDTLVISWNKMEEVRQARLKAVVRAARKKHLPPPTSPGAEADPGI